MPRDREQRSIDESTANISGRTYTADIVTPGNMSDEEKQSPPSFDQEYLVGWDGVDDPLNPRCRPALQKWLFILVVSLGSLLVSV